MSPAATLEWLTPFFATMGITRVADVTGLDRIGIPVTSVCRPNSRSLSVSQGKGLSRDAAKASGVMEAIELYHAERIHLPLKYASYEELRYTHDVVDPDDLPSTADARFHPDLKLLWVEAWDMMNEEVVWLPLETIHTDYTLPPHPGSGCFAASSNGLAGGNNLLEALSHAICEVVERDATTLLHLSRMAGSRASRVRLDSVRDEACCRVLDLCDRAEVTVAVWNATSEFGLPVFECVIAEREDYPLHRLHAAAGMGCHPVREVALMRALTEAIQSRLTLITGSRDDLFRADYTRIRDSDRQRELRGHLQEESEEVDFASVCTFESESFEEDVLWELRQLRGSGVQRVLVVDLCRAEFNIPVVRAVIPGLEGVDHIPGFVPGNRARQLMGNAG